MPGMSGEDFLKELRKIKKLPVIVLSAKIAKESKINVLNIGADAFIEKPFDKDELLAIIGATIRRYKDFNDKKYVKSKILNFKDLNVDLDSMTVTAKKT